MSAYVVLGSLIVAILWNMASERFWAALVVFLVTALSYSIYFYGPAEYLMHHLSYWGYLSLEPVFTIALLYFIRNNTSTALMLLFVILMLTHLVCFLIEHIGVNIDDIYQYVCWGFFILEVLILLSERVTNEVLKLCDQFCHSLNLDRHDPDHWSKNSFGAIK